MKRDMRIYRIHIPKSLPIGNVTITERIIESFHSYDFEKVIMVLNKRVIHKFLQLLN